MDEKETPNKKAPPAEWVNVETLTPWPQNPRLNDHAVEAVAESIKRYGFGAPLVARRNGEIIAGHTRLKAAQSLGLKEVPVRYLDLTEREAHLLSIADNKLGEIASWDFTALSELLKEYDHQEVEYTGFTQKDIDRMDKDFGPTGEEGQGQLDETNMHICPNCGYEF